MANLETGQPAISNGLFAESYEGEARSDCETIDALELTSKPEVMNVDFEPYISARSNPARAFRQAIARGVDPNLVARTVIEAATEEYPRLRYLPDGTARVVALFRDVLPSPLFDFAFRKQIQMNDD